MFACIVSGVESLVAKKLLLGYASLRGEIAFDALVPAQLCGRICLVCFVRVFVPKPFLDALYDGASEISCSGCVATTNYLARFDQQDAWWLSWWLLASAIS